MILISLLLLVKTPFAPPPFGRLQNHIGRLHAVQPPVIDSEQAPDCSQVRKAHIRAEVYPAPPKVIESHRDDWRLISMIIENLYDLFVLRRLARRLKTYCEMQHILRRLARRLKTKSGLSISGKCADLSLPDPSPTPPRRALTSLGSWRSVVCWADFYFLIC